MPGIILWCLEHLELKDLGRPVAFLAKMIGHRPLAVQLVGKGLLDPTRMKRLLDRSSPREVMLDVLMIVSDLARMDKVRFGLIECLLLHVTSCLSCANILKFGGTPCHLCTT